MAFTLAAGCHELGHLLVLALLRKRIYGLSLGVFGAVIETASLGYVEEAICAAAGPVMNFLLFFFCLHNWFIFAFCNLVLLVYNLLPLYPLDGGRAFRALLLLLLPERVAMRCTHIVGMLVCGVILVTAITMTTLYQCGIWPMFAAAIILWKIGRNTAGASD